MRFCMQHWTALRAAIEQRGLSGFVAKGGEEAMRQTVDELNGLKDPTAPYDPLMSAHWAIASRALELGGLYLLSGEYCPLCEYEKNVADAKAEEWITGSTDAVLKDFREHGWVREVPIA